MTKIKLKICMGTMCYVMGGAQLKDAVETLPPEIKRHLDISYATCLDYCGREQAPPYIELNGRMIAGVTNNNLIQILNEEIRNAVR